MENKEQKKGKKITVGFKCEPSIKVKLAKDAEKLGLTLSLYTESIISKYYEKVKGETGLPEKLTKSLLKSTLTYPQELETMFCNLIEGKVSPLILLIEDLRELMTNHMSALDKVAEDVELVCLMEENEKLNQELAEIVGNEDLQELYERYKDETMEYQTKEGEKKSVKITSYSDLITAMIETVFDKN